MAFLRTQTHRIGFDLIPKHASWLNQIEIWFSILARKLLRRGSFTSQRDLKPRIERFIAYFNPTPAKPFKWTKTGKPLVPRAQLDVQFPARSTRSAAHRADVDAKTDRAPPHRISPQPLHRAVVTCRGVLAHPPRVLQSVPSRPERNA